jgi:GNAT superfamily N-acetyltransferase
LVASTLIALKTDDGEIIGGLPGSTYWDWLEIDNFFIPEEFRGKGLGSSLLQRAETIAMQRGVKRCFLSTFDFQARTFYERHG